MSEFQGDTIVVFSKDVELYVAIRQENERGSKPISINQLLEMANAPIRIHFTDDDKLLSEIESRLEFLPDSIIVEPDSESDFIVPNDIE